MRSRTRRRAADRERRRRIRLRGGGLSAALVALAVAVVGAGMAAGQGSGAAAGGLLARGSSGPGVAAVQRALGLRASGRFGAATDGAVRDFQRRRGLLVDGVVGPQTMGALGLGAPASAAPRGDPAATGGTAGGTATGTAPAGLQRIAQCESGGNPRAIGGGGRYRGKYQFTYETWRSVGGSGDPAAASEAEQDRRAAALYGRSGTSSWPVCG